MKLSFDQWFDIFVDHCRKALKYEGPIDKDSAYLDYDNDLEPEDAARTFVKEMNA